MNKLKLTTDTTYGVVLGDPQVFEVGGSVLLGVGNGAVRLKGPTFLVGELVVGELHQLGPQLEQLVVSVDHLDGHNVVVFCWPNHNFPQL